MQQKLRHLLSLTLLVLLSACDKSTDAPANAALAPASLVAVAKPGPASESSQSSPQSPSGSRLRSVYFQGEDGSRVHYGFFDKERQERCSFEYASGGAGEPFAYRCYPEAGASRPCDEPVRYYQDSNCTVPLFSVWKRTEDPKRDKYFRVTESSWGEDCAGQPVAPGFYLVKRWFKPAAVYQIMPFDKSCSEFTLGFEDYRFFEFGERIPDEAFVRAELLTDLPK